MSLYTHLYVGPYAEWLVPEGKGPQSQPYDADGNPIGERLTDNTGQSDAPVIKRGRKRYYQICFSPAFQQPTYPGRESSFSGDSLYVGVLDLTAVDRRAELKWFAKTYAPDLKLLAAHFGAAPTLRWGVLSWWT